MNISIQSPIIRWARFLMRLFHIDLRNLGIMPYHVQARMSQESLQSEDISPRSQVGDRESMSEFMRIDFMDIGSFTYAPKSCRKESLLNGEPKFQIKRGASGFSVVPRLARYRQIVLRVIFPIYTCLPFPPLAPPITPCLT